jgi:uncharacterized protein YbjT (DUF2867 family)
MANPSNIILVTGATGQQGGAAARHLLADGWRVRALVRDPNKPAAQALAEQGAELIQGDLDDRASLESALQDAYGVFSVQTSFTAEGTAGEIRQGKALAVAAVASSVQHFVYSSVGGAERNTGIPHFESKRGIEEHIAQLDLPVTILRPVFFMENFRSFALPKEQDGVLTLAMAMQPERELQLLAVDDIGAFVALAFAKPQDYIGAALEIAGDSLTLPAALEELGRAAGKPTHYVELPLEGVMQYNEDLGRMFGWFQEAGYAADSAALRKIHPGLKDFRAWVQESQGTSV